MRTGETVAGLWRYPIKSMQGEGITRSDVTARGLAGDRALALVDTASNRAAAVRSWGAKLFHYQAAYSTEPTGDGAAPEIHITAPDGTTFTSTAEDANARLSADLGRPLRLSSHATPGLLVEFPAGTLGGDRATVTEAPLAGRAPAGTFFDVAPLHLMATSTLDHLRAAFPAGQIDIRRFRANILVQTSAEPFVENSWTGRRLAIGDQVVLKVTMACPRCVNVTMPQAGLPRDATVLREIAKRNSVALGPIGSLPCAGAYAEVVQAGHVRQGDAIHWLD